LNLEFEIEKIIIEFYIKNMEVERRSAEKAEKIETDIPLDMYQVSGQDPITEHSFNRYLQCREQDEAIKENVEIEEIEKTIEAEEAEELHYLLEMKIAKIPREERTLMIREGLNHPSPRVQKVFVEMIKFAPESDQSSLREIVLQKTKEGLKSKDIRVQTIYARMIERGFAYLEECVPLIREGLNHPNIEVQKIVASIISYAPEKEQESLRELFLEKIEKNIENSDTKTQKTLMRMVWVVPLTERTALVRKGLSCQNTEVQKAAADRIFSTPEKDWTLLIEKGLNSQNIEVWSIVVKAIVHMPIEKQKFFQEIFFQKIREGLENQDTQVQEVAADIIHMVPEEKRAAFIEEAINHPNPEVRIIATGKIWSVSKEEQKHLEELVLQRVKEDFKNPNVEIFKAATEMRTRAPDEEQMSLVEIMMTRIRKELKNPSVEIWEMVANNIHRFSEEERVELILSGLDSQNVEIQKMAAKMVNFTINRTEQNRILDIISEKGLGDEVIKNPLYDKKMLIIIDFQDRNLIKLAQKQF